jgi:hypothetical protein
MRGLSQQFVWLAAWLRRVFPLPVRNRVVACGRTGLLARLRRVLPPPCGEVESGEATLGGGEPQAWRAKIRPLRVMVGPPCFERPPQPHRSDTPTRPAPAAPLDLPARGRYGRIRGRVLLVATELGG